jgi:rhodanese-related sulfurtransferase
VIACSINSNEGFTKLVNVEGGMGAWKKAGLPTRS